ncbi:cell division protein FtsQ/DivIB [Solimicrobium silvestre]|uniref:Cell division protein FtsQ n=1 Tax=Solimicrobium silvestre TaxID=2099400 RepID=A0A2S9H5I5_9BURK|nr:cell division protein FtsQ/DivIB [Solimicrobium silvestre]PRC95201.1 Cell division protein FtsQ [Solimicrobium silvestre]
MWQDIKLLNATANVLFGACALLLLLSGIWVVMHRPMFTLNVIQVEGQDNTVLKHVNSEIIRSTALPRIKGNFFTTNLDTVRSSFEQVPWVRKASVRREWPDKLIVTLEEHMPLGTWGEDGQLLSVKGEIFTANLAEAEEDTKLLEFSGPVGSEKDVLAHYLEFKEWFKAIELTPLAVAYSKRYAWLIKLDNGVAVQLGREENSAVLKERVSRLLHVYPELTNRLQGKIESVDLRYPNGFALKNLGQELSVVGKKKKQ